MKKLMGTIRRYLLFSTRYQLTMVCIACLVSVMCVYQVISSISLYMNDAVPMRHGVDREALLHNLELMKTANWDGLTEVLARTTEHNRCLCISLFPLFLFNL